MALILQIACGVWVGGLALFFTLIGTIAVGEKIETVRRRRRMGFEWRHAISR